MKFVVVSDTHNKLSHLKIPDGDVLLHAGDATGGGSEQEWVKFNEDLDKLPHKYKVCIPGNHDWICQRNERLARELLSNADLLIDELTIIDKVRIWGSPWQPKFYNWAFNMNRGAEIKRMWDLIPNDIDILITHGPPHGILDMAPRAFSSYGFDNVGCEELRIAVDRVKPRYHVFGHIHASYGTGKVGETTFINGSNLNESYQPANQPIVFTLEK